MNGKKASVCSDMILIRGLFRGKYHWGIFPDVLQSRFPHKNIILADIAGCGERSAERSPNTIEGMVESIRARLKPAGKIDIISISMGGMIALKWAELYPEEVGHLVCINTSTKEFTPFYQRLLPKNYLKIIRALFSKPATREALIYSMISNQPLNTDIVKHWTLLNHRYPMQRMNFVRQLTASLTFSGKQPDCRLLFISSLKDRLVSYKATQAMAMHWQADFISNPDDGHDIPLDNPIWLCEQLARWLSECE
ncbi:alpha/beta fold hydrolase [Vibrio mangrovi]|uniref:Alpha/beta hydrolase n=1 Tax=Vibrio mangrovi TaxID=474394 RepID=A0A1Y6IN23_9VIBR|nr:alpha/beta hydrolase [Vibrio mangrovi]MDW6004156.1 alpha/beta hydrolase [Vibrio mangrovi]SMR99047.1 Putative aminoacrylate hydrolase RutD [Vibrio mangrovi]